MNTTVVETANIQAYIMNTTVVKTNIQAYIMNTTVVERQTFRPTLWTPLL